MKYLFDTDTLSELVGRRRGMLRDRFGAIAEDDQATSSITLGESLHGARKRTDARGAMLAARIEQVLSPLTVLPFDTEAASAYADIRVALEAQGRPIGEADTRIAGIARSRGLIVVTGNVRHFERVPGLRVENWLT